MFEDRITAGLSLAEELVQKEGSLDETVVVGITRGGVVIAAVIARILGIPLQPLVVKKIGAPGNEELAVGAIAPKDIIYWDTAVVKELGLEKYDLAELAEEKVPEFQVSEKMLKAFGNLERVRNKTVYLVDDGVATGATAKAALLALKQYRAKRVILITPVIAEMVYNELVNAFDQIVTLSIAEHFHSVGDFYQSFTPISDEDVITILTDRK